MATKPPHDQPAENEPERRRKPWPAAGDAPTIDYDQHTGGEANQNTRHFGDYEILEEIARGGMGVVYKARQISLHRIVALKMIRSGDLATKQDADRFHAEAEAAANLDHPNIVSIFEVGHHDGQHYFSMAYVDGKSLGEMTREHPLPGRTAAEYCQTIAQAIHYAHQQQTLHRDIKPSNVLIDRTDQPRVTDFGLAKRVGSDSDLTATGQVLGTPNYMSPEQALGDNKCVGPRSDVYSLGATLYTLITGRPPFQADNTVATLLQVIDKEPVAPRELNPAIDPDLETICLKCLDKEPAKRYAAAEQLAEDLGRYLRREPITARPISRPARSWRWCKRNPAVAGLLTVVALTLLAGILVSSYFAVSASEEAHLATIAEGKAKLEEGKAKAKEREAKVAEQRALGLVDQLEKERERLIFENYVANIAVAQGKIRDGIHHAALRILEDAPTHLRHWEWGHLMDFCLGEVVRLGGTPGGLHMSIATTSDLKRLVLSAGGKAQVWDLADVRLMRQIEKCPAHCLLPGQAEILVARENEVTREKLDSETVVARWPTRAATVKQLAWCAGRNCVLEKLADGSVQFVDVEDGSVLRRLPPEIAKGRVVSFSRDGQRVLVHSGNNATVWDLTRGELVFQVERLFSQTWCSAALSDDGRRVLSGHREMKSVLWDVETGEPIHEIANQRGQVRAVAFSPDGRYGISGGTFGVQYWDLTTGKLMQELGCHDENVVSLAFAPNARWVLAAGPGQLRIWDVAGQNGVAVFRPGSHQGAWPYCSLALSSDGQKLVTTGWEDAGVRVFDLGSDTLLWKLDGEKPAPLVAASPDGRWAVTSTRQQTADVWDLATGKIVGTARDRAHARTIVVHPDNDRFAVGCGKSGVRIWSLPGCEKLATIKPEGRGMNCFDYSPDGRVLLARSGDSIVAWDLEKGKERASLPLESPSTPAGSQASGAFFPDSRRALLSTKTGALVWDSVTGKVLDRYEAGKGAPSLAISPDEKRVFLGCWDKSVRVWDVGRGREVMSFTSHSGGIVSLGMSKDGRVLATGGCGGARDVRVYRALNWRKSSGELQEEKVELWRAEFKRIATANAAPVPPENASYLVSGEAPIVEP
jgi:WD40 repeat protein/tRNA A-37 threonylcarbamoyl transferase component Bud32